MRRPVPEPDPQHVLLDALNEAIYIAEDHLHALGYSQEAIMDCGPDFNEDTGYRGHQSVVFTSSDIEEMGGGEEAYDTIMAVGTRDLDCKIEEARRTLRNLNALLTGGGEEDEED